MGLERIVDIATDGRHLSAHRGFMLVSEDRQEVGRVPLDDIAAVIVHAHGVTWTTSLLVALAERGAIMVLCGSNHAPVALCLPIDGHHAQNARLRANGTQAAPWSSNYGGARWSPRSTGSAPCCLPMANLPMPSTFWHVK
ncbi:MAG: CRISPR-associated endonuclease Cas1 [Niveispirillum sp.]|uniref:CRISPR-associated endonuclease Cas1 n=1 Tax=Niveispirillum sp. TaxID=1917217 RepID=UPI0040363CD1